MVFLVLSLACTGGSPAGGGDTAAQDGGGTGDGGAQVPDEQGSIPAIRVSGDVTWTLAFDADAQAQGFTDCSYTRSYEGVQVLDLGYLCPDCAVISQGDATISQGLDCYSQISSDPQTVRTEAWGWSDDGRFFRSGLEQYPLGELSSIDPTASTGADLSWESSSDLSPGGTMTLSAAGSIRWLIDDQALLPDPWPVRTEPYACGWPTNDPGTLSLDYELGLGKTFPNVRLVDQCGERPALWDLYGSWLVIDTAQPDCGPCRSMASTAEAFLNQMADEGIDVKFVSLLGAGLSEPWATPSQDVYDAWVTSYNPTTPLLQDRGFGYALFPAFAEAETGEAFGYPTWIVVDPTMKPVAVNVGFGSWDAVAEIIRAGQ